ncbi:response regulator [Synergistaceae bacterium OttesenSCG-928-I11]|nr:response regulator [Synergistaceae bacterium OttesenSCG-928-I11]
MENDQYLSVVNELLDRSVSFAYVTDPRTDEIVCISAKTRAHFGVENQPTGSKCWQWIEKNATSACDSCAKMALLDNPGITVESDQYVFSTGRCYKRHDSAIRWFDGRELHLHLLDDVTDSYDAHIEPKEIESELDDALERERQSRQNFLVHMSHELRSQLNSVMGMASIAREESDLNKIRYAMERIELVSSNMIALLDDILYMSDLESLEEAGEYEAIDTLPPKEEMQQSLRDARKQSVEILRGIPDCVILLAEDVEIHREIMFTYLEDTGIQIDVARTGAEAVKLFSMNPDRYHLILMDVQMPEMNGHEAARRIRALPVAHAEDVPIIAMTANALPEDEEKSLSAGMNGHITKPVDWTDLLSILVYHLKPKDA